MKICLFAIRIRKIDDRIRVDARERGGSGTLRVDNDVFFYHVECHSQCIKERAIETTVRVFVPRERRYVFVCCSYRDLTDEESRPPRNFLRALSYTFPPYSRFIHHSSLSHSLTFSFSLSLTHLHILSRTHSLSLFFSPSLSLYALARTMHS